MTNSRIKLLLILFSPVFMLFGYLFVVGAINYSGFCWAEKRWLSDEEYIRAAARLVQVKGPGQELEYDLSDSPEYAQKRAMQEKEGRVLVYDDFDPELWDIVAHNGYKVAYPKAALKRLTVEEFFKKYPNCCTVVHDSFSPHDVTIKVVSDATLYNAKHNDRITLKNVKTYIGVTNCGVAHYDYDTDY